MQVIANVTFVSTRYLIQVLLYFETVKLSGKAIENDTITATADKVLTIKFLWVKKMYAFPHKILMLLKYHSNNLCVPSLLLSYAKSHF